jgi:predicted regulator of Ras-like GTPase activity (Roadblock/LC7/MglB family)
LSIETILEELVALVPFAKSALLFDHQGEVVAAAGAKEELDHLVGAYQGLALTAARGAADRCAAGDVRQMVCRYEKASVVVHPLKDGYYLVLVLGKDALPPVAAHQASVAAEALNVEIG